MAFRIGTLFKRKRAAEMPPLLPEENPLLPGEIINPDEGHFEEMEALAAELESVREDHRKLLDKFSSLKWQYDNASQLFKRADKELNNIRKERNAEADYWRAEYYKVHDLLIKERGGDGKGQENPGPSSS